MRKVALLLAILMIAGQTYGLCYPATVDNVLSEKSKSDLHPVQDVAKIAGVANSGVNKMMDTKPMTEIMTPIEKVRKETVKGTYTITNRLWDILTFRSFREKK